MSLIRGCDEVSSESKFYKDADAYWKTVSADVNGMLGGYSFISSIDTSGSKSFLKEFIRGPKATLQRGRALDCGAGIGRVSKNFLLQIFDTVDLLEQNGDFLKQARVYLGPTLSSRIGEYICCGIQDANLKDDYYDVIWLQWVTGHLTDLHFVSFLKKCQEALRKNGLVIVKENITASALEWDETDSSVARNYEQLHSILEQSGLHIVKEELQKNFPSELYKVYMIALSKDPS